MRTVLVALKHLLFGLNSYITKKEISTGNGNVKVL